MTNQMADVGAHAALVVTPSYYKNGMHNRAMINHFTKVCTKLDQIWARQLIKDFWTVSDFVLVGCWQQ